jgi:L-ascorbate metabolism protein UlaG (beta-lactamase superfamily)
MRTQPRRASRTDRRRDPHSARSGLVFTFLLAAALAAAAATGQPFEKDAIPTSAGDVEITFVGHGTLVLIHGGKVIHVDPYAKLADYTALPRADLILITHAHRDHLDPAALAAVRTATTEIVAASVCRGKIEGARFIGNGESVVAAGVPIAAVPAYNLVGMRSEGTPYHPKGEGNGYVLTFADTRVYVAGDTEDTPEMKALEEIDVAFLPMNLPYTMTPEMVAAAARAFRPRILYPYHYGDTDPARLVELLAGEKDIEVRVRRMR